MIRKAVNRNSDKKIRACRLKHALKYTLILSIRNTGNGKKIDVHIHKCSSEEG